MDSFIWAAIEEAEKGAAEGGIPIGAVLVEDGHVVGRGRNRRVQDDNPVMHAEIASLQDAGRGRNYEQSVLYSTLAPCYMCAGAIVQFRIPEVVIGESATFEGAVPFLKKMGVRVVDLRSDICRGLMSEFVANSPDLWKEDVGANIKPDGDSHSTNFHGLNLVGNNSATVVG